MLSVDCFGIYTTGDEEIKIMVWFNSNSAALALFRADSLDLERGGVSISNSMFNGRVEVRGENIYYRLNERTREQTGYDVIIFHRLEDYEPINPEDWFQQQRGSE